MNSVQLIGRLAFDVELKEMSGEKVVVNNRLAVQKSNNESDFFDIVAWDNQARIMANYYKKGYEVAINGRLSTKLKKKKESSESYMATYVIVERISFTYGNPRTANIDEVAHNILTSFHNNDEAKGFLE